MVGDEQPQDARDEPTVDRLRHRLRAIAIIVVLGLLAFRAAGLPLIQVATGVALDDNGVIFFTLSGTLLVLLGLEVPAFLSGLRK